MTTRRNLQEARQNLPEVRRSSGTAWSPLREMSRMQRRFERLFDEFPSVLAFPNLLGDLGAADTEYTFSPPCDIEEAEGHFMVTFDLPGVRKEDVKIEMRDNQLIVSGERKREERREEGGRALGIERYYGAFERSFALPTNVDADKIEANYQDGVLQVVIPKAESSKSRVIQIREQKGQQQQLPKREEEAKAEKSA